MVDRSGIGLRTVFLPRPSLQSITTTTATRTINDLTTQIGTLGVRGSTQPLPRNHSLDKWQNFVVNPAIGQEFGNDLQLSEIVHAENKDELLLDLRGVVFFRAQDIGLEDQKTLSRKLGELSGKPQDSALYIHPLTPKDSEKDDQILVISAERRNKRAQVEDSTRFASKDWHFDITFEPVPSDYSILKIHTAPENGGETLWASAYEAYSRLSPEFAKFLEGKEALHEATSSDKYAEAAGITLRTDVRGSPLNSGPGLSAIHPVIRVSKYPTLGRSYSH
ncbi:hypothetical protein L198_04247 [Cryptococcus wingfieldii CBS 7118]|uniref:TauD/TfdA-like domain-containing protein n=1 Tax=Cryptococcus wingfieldii CBS 7118 TaxID=1295528 RepID=A0A1E3J6R0_9TREE|nr:hypothetical protein L198_04247 [Cryptococcus wingfieldii CBS 7118]ODN96532.1 hypothetical protein L198_04247 [Cryptococcus wingfieldii CBS 7118]